MVYNCGLWLTSAIRMVYSLGLWLTLAIGIAYSRRLWLTPAISMIRSHLSCNAYLHDASALVLQEFIAEHALNARIIVRPLHKKRFSYIKAN